MLLNEFREYLISTLGLDRRTAANCLVPIRRVLPFLRALDADGNLLPEKVTLDGLLRFLYAVPGPGRGTLPYAWTHFRDFCATRGIELPTIPQKPLGRPASLPHAMTEHFRAILGQHGVPTYIESARWSDVRWPDSRELDIPITVSADPQRSTILVPEAALDHLVVMFWWANPHDYDPNRPLVPVQPESTQPVRALEIRRSIRVLARIEEGNAIAVEREWKIRQTGHNQTIKATMIARGQTPPAFLDKYDARPEGHYGPAPLAPLAPVTEVTKEHG